MQKARPHIATRFTIDPESGDIDVILLVEREIVNWHRISKAVYDTDGMDVLNNAAAALVEAYEIKHGLRDEDEGR